VSFIIGSIFFFGALICNSISFWDKYANYFILGGFFYLYIATATNFLIHMSLSVDCLWIKENNKIYFNAVGYILLNIPIAALYAYVGITYILNL
jgi:LIVCS family branched-chain amino acid:cation transporter